MDVFVIVALIVAILFIAFFSGIEVAFTTANRLGIELKKKQGAASGILLSFLADNPSRFTGTVLVGINFFLVIFILFFSTLLNEMLHTIGITNSLILPLRLLLEILLSMAVIIVIGKFIPKAIFRTNSDVLLSFSARSGLLGFCYDIFYSVSSLFVRISQWILTIIFDMRIDKKKEPFLRSDLEYFFQQTKEFNEENKEANTDLFENALSLHTVKVRECLIPRKEIEGVLLETTVEEARKKFVDSRLSKLVVYDGNIDHIVGYIHQLGLFKNPATIQDMLLPIPAIPESMSATDLISKFSREEKVLHG